MNWSEWHRFSELTDHPARDCGDGVYQVRAASEDGKPVPIQRACGTDDEGILYIGEGKLLDRVGRLLRIFESNPKRHHNFISVFLDYDLERLCDRGMLEVRWAECDDCKNEERRLLDDYKKRTGDIPPGNCKH